MCSLAHGMAHGEINQHRIGFIYFPERIFQMQTQEYIIVTNRMEIGACVMAHT